MSEKEMSCGTCKHRLQDGETNYCRRYPPTPTYAPVANKLTRETMFVLQGAMPPVNLGNFCGEWQLTKPLIN